jgi:retron-type reverse transcriptase
LQKNKWFLKCDIKKYFANINHQILINQINSKIKDKELIHLISIIIQNAGEEKSLPIGNLTSQFFANIYLNEFDHFVKRELKCEYYIRYMDDFVIFSSDKEILKIYKTKIKEFLTTLHLTINESHSFLNQTLNGLSFLGVRIFKKLIRIKKENLKRSLNNLKASKYLLAKQKITYEAYYNSVNSIFAHLQNYSTHLFLQKELQKGYLV